MREFLKGLELEKETIDTIMTEYGKGVTKDKDKVKELEKQVKEYQDQLKEYEGKIVELESISKDSEKIQTELAELKAKQEEEAARKQQEEEHKVFISNLEPVFGDREFVNEFTKNAIIEQMKELVKENNGKSYKETFEELIKDQEGLFKNPQAPEEMSGVNENLDGNLGENKKEIPLIW